MVTDNRKLQSRKRILDSIRRAGRVARIDLSSETGVSPATVTTVTAEMLREGLIEEVPRDPADADARRGRPRVDLKLRGAARVVAGVKITDRTLSTVILDFEGNQLGARDCPTPTPTMAAGALADALVTCVAETAAAASIDPDTVAGVGIGIPGIVDTQTGVCHWSPAVTERNLPLRDIIAEAFGKPAFLDNDANLVAMAEKYFGLGTDVSDFLVVTVEAGVGLGIVIGGEVYRGSRGCGAEFGHTKVQIDGALCRCGQRGCLEAYVADYALLREASLGGFGSASGSPERRVQDLLHAARDGDPRASMIVERARRMFAMGLANLVNIFDPQLIILAGERMQFDHLYASEVVAAIRNSIVQIDTEPPEIVIHRWGDQMWAKGAAAYALDNIAEIALREMAETGA